MRVESYAQIRAVYAQESSLCAIKCCAQRAERLYGHLVSAGSQLSLHVSKRCLFEIKAVSNDPFDPGVHAFLPVKASEKRGSRGYRRRQWNAGELGFPGSDGFSPSRVVVRVGNDDVVDFSLGWRCRLFHCGQRPIFSVLRLLQTKCWRRGRDSNSRSTC